MTAAAHTPAGLLVCLLLVGAATGASQPYNVLYLVADDLRPEFLNAYGQMYMHTPAVDKLAETGLVFSNAYCQMAVCSPSRNSFQSGRRPHHTGIMDNGKGSFRSDGLDSNGPGSTWITMPEHFKKSGYLTLGGGKTYHPGSPPNWDEPSSWSQDMKYFPFSYYQKDDYDGPCPGPKYKSSKCASTIDTWCNLDEKDSHFYDFHLRNNTVARLRYAAQQLQDTGKPFFVQSGFARPHAPWRVPQKYWDLYKDEDIPLAKHKLLPENAPGIAWHQQGFYNSSDATVHCPEITKPIEDAVARSMRHAYMAAVSWMDHQVGEVLDELDALGLTDSTVVVFHGDHGWQLGEHNSFHKETNWELGTRVPLIMRAPFMANSTNKKTNILAELVDVYPTIAELSGSGAPHDTLDGVSLVPAFEDPSRLSIPSVATANKTVAYSQFPHTTNFNCSVYKDGACTPSPDPDVKKMGYSIRSHEWRYTVWLPTVDDTAFVNWTYPPVHELYNYATSSEADFDSLDTVNVADANPDLVSEFFTQAKWFFDSFLPPHKKP